MKQAKSIAMSRAVDQALDIGGTALIGIDFDIMTIGKNMIVVCANGTAVIVKRKDNDD